MVGRQVKYRGQACQIIEILDSEQALVVQCNATDLPRSIQGNQFGEASRRVQTCHTLKLYDDDHQLNVEIVDWLTQASF